MQSFHLSFEYSAWWLLPIVLVSFGLAWLFYSGPTSWSKREKQFLGTLRFLALFFLLTLLLNPTLNFVASHKEKPLFPLLVDNSTSVPLVMKNIPEIKKTIASIKKTLEKNGFDVPVFVFDEELSKLDSLSFSHGSSDLVKLLGQGEKSLTKAQNAHMVLVTDGIFNSGASPDFQYYHSHIISLGLGDTIPRKDIALKSVQNNSVAFLGNKFTMRVEVKSNGYKGQETEILLKGSKNNLLEKQKITMLEDNWHGQIDFAVPAYEKGYQRYTIEIPPLRGESNLINNKLTTYVDVVDDRENILLVSPSPHPTIKAIRAALSKTENIQFDLLIPGYEEPKPKTYDVIILHDCLLSTWADARKYTKESTSILYIVGSQSDLAKFNAENGIVQVPNQQQIDQINPALNPSFAKFKLNENMGSLFSKLPPVEVPFGEIKVKTGTEILLYQQVSGVTSPNPLFLFGQTTRKTGVLLTDGLWLWHLHEFMANGNAQLTDELISKTIQYLSSKEDKRKFRIYSHQKEYFEGEPAQIEIELYNDLYEKVYNQKAVLQIQSANGQHKKYDFSPSQGNTALWVPSLPPGVYKVNATTQYAGKQHTAYAEFVVKERQLEALDLQANFPLLRQLGTQTKGDFFPWSRRTQLLEKIENMKAIPIWKSAETKRELIDETWYYLLLFLLIATEWTARRYTGGY